MKTKLLHMGQTILILLFGAVSLSAQQVTSTVSDVKDIAERYFKENLDFNKIVGLTAAIIINDTVVWSKGYGYADKADKIPMTTQTIINIGSITKTFTSLAVMQLKEKGLLDIDQPLNTYLPAFHPKDPYGALKDITLKSVLIHASGIQPDIWKNSDLGTGKYTDVLGFINDTYISYPPGMVGLYSNAGYNILGALIATLSKKDYADYIRQHIFNPLNMRHSGFAMDSLANRSKIYLGGKVVKEYALRDIASGGIYTSMEDFTKYTIGLLKAYQGTDSTVIQPRTIWEMFTLHNQHVSVESNKKGLGWFMFKNDSSFAVYHAGSAGFAQAKLLVIPDSRFAVIVMTNAAEGSSVAEQFCFSFLNQFNLSVPDLFPPPVTGAVHQEAVSTTISITDLKKHIGNYGQAGGYSHVYLQDHQLRMQQGTKNLVLKPVTKDEYIPMEISGDTLMAMKERRLIFKEIKGFTFLFLRINGREYENGVKLEKVDSDLWKNRRGTYDHFGYQMLVGDTKFKQIDIYITPDQVLMMRLTTYGSVRTIPLRVISDHAAITCGINAGFGGFTVTFYKKGHAAIVDMGGLTFKKSS